jgi:outer membrane protein assembly factor BamA
MRTRWLWLFLALWMSAVAVCFGQNQSKAPLSSLPASERLLISITVKGNHRFSADAIIAASELKIGMTVTEADFKRASQLLGETGILTDVGYSYSYSSEGTKLEFSVIEAEKFVPARFEDFVWFSDEELLSRIRQEVPLFTGELPLTGRMPDQLSDVLQAMLVENKIPGNVEYERTGKPNEPPDAIVYKVSDVAIQIRNVEFTGASEAEQSSLRAAAKRVFDTEYSRAVLGTLVQRQLLPVYFERGYLKAAFSAPQPKVVKKSSPENSDTLRNLTVVDVVFAVTPGQQYKLKSLEWSGNHELSTDALLKMVRAPLGEPANTVKLTDNLKDIQKLYGSRGYVTAAINPHLDFDDADGTVSIRLEVKEGFVYHMGELEFRGLDNSLMAKLRNAWKIRPGDIYDSTYLSDYLESTRKLLPSRLDWDVTPHVTPNQRDKTVDVDLIYSVKAPK